MSVIPWSLRNIAILLLCFAFVKLNAQIPYPAKKGSKSVLLLGGTSHLGNGKVIKNSAIGIRNGKIDLVLTSIDIRLDTSKYDTIIHFEGKHLYPSFIAPNSRLGLVEIDAVRASRDFDDVGDFNPNIRSLTAFNTESRIISTIRSNGVLLAQVSPKGGIISGTSSVFNLEGWNWEDAVLKVDDGIHLNWPSRYLKSNLNNKKNADKSDEDYIRKVELIKEFFSKSEAYQKAGFHLESNLRYEAMKKIFDKDAKVYIHANRIQEILDAIYFFDQYDFNIVLVGANDAWLASDLLKDRNIPVILRRVHSLPMNEDDDIDLPFKLPKILSDKGLLVALENSGSMEAMGTRNLPFYAGTACQYGVEREKALSMITLNTAKILGIDEQVGSVEEGKDATLFISVGDALDMKTNKIEVALVEGKFIDLDNPQKALYRKYRAKYKEGVN